MQREKVRMRKVNSNDSYTSAVKHIKERFMSFWVNSKASFYTGNLTVRLRVFVENYCSYRVEEMKSLNSSKSHRLFDFVPSVKPSAVSVMLVFVCGVLWVKNETTNERLIALESRLHCFSCVKSVSTENLDKMTLSPTKDSTKYHYKNIRTPISEGIGHTNSGEVVYLVLRLTFRHKFKILSFLPSGETSRRGFLRFIFYFFGTARYIKTPMENTLCK